MDDAVVVSIMRCYSGNNLARDQDPFSTFSDALRSVVESSLRPEFKPGRLYELEIRLTEEPEDEMGGHSL